MIPSSEMTILLLLIDTWAEVESGLIVVRTLSFFRRTSLEQNSRDCPKDKVLEIGRISPKLFRLSKLMELESPPLPSELLKEI